MKRVSFFPYIGGKFYIADKIIKLMPKHKIYVEVFGGSGKIILTKPKSDVEIYNDADGRLANLFYVTAFKFQEFEEKVNRLVYSRALYDKFIEEFKQAINIKELGDVDLAVKTHFVLHAAFAGQINKKSFSIDYTRSTSKRFFNGVDKLQDIHERLKNVVIECKDYAYMLERHTKRDDTFIYLDPPYFGAEHYYDVFFTYDDHVKMIELLKKCKAKWLLSGYHNDLYDTELKDFYMIEMSAVKYSRGITYITKDAITERPKSTEVLWSNYEISLDKLN